MEHFYDYVQAIIYIYRARIIRKPGNTRKCFNGRTG